VHRLIKPMNKTTQGMRCVFFLHTIFVGQFVRRRRPLQTPKFLGIFAEVIFRLVFHFSRVI
jgi:hypothetical protein